MEMYARLYKLLYDHAMADLPTGLGTQLRHLIELLDDGVSAANDYSGMRYRPRYTPIVRALAGGQALTIGQLAEAAGITQPAATQTVAVMVKDGFVDVAAGPLDARQRVVELSARGRELLPRLQQAWQATERAAAGLDAESGLSTAVAAALAALAREPFAQRITDALKTTAPATKRKKSP
jgi:MarR family transcriptional regulator, organic hydroperoxide resistance regulator